MIERKIVKTNFLEYTVSEFIKKTLGDVPIKDISLERAPNGERITIFTSTPGLVIGREGSNIRKLTVTLKEKFNFENPQIKIGEVKDISLSAGIVAKRIANDLARFGSQKFRLTGFRALEGIMNAGAMGAEIRITGKLPAARAKSWRFVKGYIKKTGYVSDFLVDHAIDGVTLKTGVVGIKVSIMLPNTPLPDRIEYLANVVPAEIVAKVVATKAVIADEDIIEEKIVSKEKKVSKGKDKVVKKVKVEEVIEDEEA